MFRSQKPFDGAFGEAICSNHFRVFLRRSRPSAPNGAVSAGRLDPLLESRRKLPWPFRRDLAHRPAIDGRSAGQGTRMTITTRPSAKPGRTSSATSSPPTATPAGSGRSSPAFRRSRTATSTSATPSRSASTSAWRRSSAATATFASTTPTRPGKSRNTSTPSSATCAGSASTGAARPSTPPTTSSSSTTGPSISSATARPMSTTRARRRCGRPAAR